MTTHAYTAATHPLPRRISTTSEDANAGPPTDMERGADDGGTPSSYNT